MIKRCCKITTAALLVLLATAFIFSNSMKDMEESREDSNVVVDVVEVVVEKIVPDHNIDVEHAVRKGAHISEFALLGALSALFYLTFEKRKRYALFFVFLYTALVASLDEFIQRFTGRGSQFTDVLIDIFGAVLGITFMLLFAFLCGCILSRRRIKNNHSLIRRIKK